MSPTKTFLALEISLEFISKIPSQMVENFENSFFV
jgi:hypothetical protein